MFDTKKKAKDKLLANYHKLKTSPFDFDKIGRYYLHSDKSNAFHLISDKTYQDLDLDEVFMFADRTISRVGQQYLYHTLRTLPKERKLIDQREHIMRFLHDNPELKQELIFQLHRLHRHEAYYITSIFQEDHIQKPKWYWLIQLLALLSISIVLLSFLYPQLLIILLFILMVNFIIHYWNKKNLYQYGVSIPQLLILNQVVKQLLNTPIPIKDLESLKQATRAIDKLGFKMSFFKLEAKLMSDIGQAVDFVIEAIKALFLIEPLLLFHVLQELDSKRLEIHQLYQWVGEIDIAISVLSLRDSLEYYSKLSLTNNSQYLCAKEVYHPLIPDCVSNSIELNGKSVLLTGSNMSGKTTFIRTLGINAILGQTINTCFAKAFIIPPLKVHSAIRISDDLMSEKSYYFEEVLSIKQMLEESQSGEQNLFLLDEMFKGTNTVERIAAGKSVLSYLQQHANIVVISTHDLELSDLLADTYNLYHFTEVVEDDHILFDYQLKVGKLKSTNAIRILELNNYPKAVTHEAKKIAKTISKLKQQD